MCSKNRRAFTLTELLVVIGILLVLSVLAATIYSTGKSSDKMRSGARAAQSAFLGAKDMAQHAKDFRGLRLTIDTTNKNLVNGFSYLRPLPLQAFTGIQVTRPGYPPNQNATTLIVPGRSLYDLDAPNALRPYSLFPSTGNTKVRIPAGDSGAVCEIAPVSTSAPYFCTLDANGNTNIQFAEIAALGGGGSILSLFTGGKAPAPPTYNAIDSTDSFASMDIRLGNDILPFQAPITLPSGCIIDLYNSQIPTAWYTQQSTLPNNVPAGAVVCGPDPTTAGNVISRNYTTQMDVMFSPRGNVTGTISAMGAMFFLLRDIRDATNGLSPLSVADYGKMQGDMLILAVFPQTGLVQTYDVDVTDANGDGIADNPLNFAQRGMSAGK